MPKGKKKTRQGGGHRQYAALPWLIRDGRPEVMLITSRGTGRWIIPKGWPNKDLEPSELAAREAYEEAGLLGRASREPCGRFSYMKRLDTGKTRECEVDVFLFQVERELDDWPEKAERRRCWMTPAQAALLVGEGGLVELLLNLAGPNPSG